MATHALPLPSIDMTKYAQENGFPSKQRRFLKVPGQHTVAAMSIVLSPGATTPTHSERQVPIIVYGESIMRIGKTMAGAVSKENIAFLLPWEVLKSSSGCSDRQENAFLR